LYETGRIATIVDATLQTKPAGMTHWSCRTMAQSQGVSKSSVNNIWRAHKLQPHRTKTFKLSRDPKFPEKMTDVVGLYLNPPQQAIVLCVDEKSRIRALDRTPPGLPIKKGRCGTGRERRRKAYLILDKTRPCIFGSGQHDYKRNGTTTLFAALDTLQGKVVGECHQRHRHQEFLKFLRRLDGEFPGDVPLHLVMDNYGTHKHEKVREWLKCHPRFVPHFVPTSSSWLNLVERWFGHLDSKAIRRGVFLSVAHLQASIEAFLEAWNKDPKPFVWTATVESIQEKLSRCRQTLEQIQPGSTSPKSRKRKAVAVWLFRRQYTSCGAGQSTGRVRGPLPCPLPGLRPKLPGVRSSISRDCCD
jgi:transposase